jgi:aminoglycoside phosphotransferase (APT) family kinase protein
MAGIALVQRDLAATRVQLEAWFGQKFNCTATVSDLRAANRAAGWSSESLLLSAELADGTSEYVLRIPPTGGGIFPEYDLEA